MSGMGGVCGECDVGGGSVVGGERVVSGGGVGGCELRVYRALVVQYDAAAGLTHQVSSYTSSYTNILLY